MKPIPQPPHWATRLLHWLHPADTLEEVEGDLAELHAYWYEQFGKRQAHIRYVLAMLSVLPPFVRRRDKKKSYSQPSLLHPDMVRNYLIVAFRSLLKYKSFSLINITGLAIGLASCMLLLVWIQDELSYDSFHVQKEELFRVVQERQYSEGETAKIAITPGPLASVLVNSFPEINQAVRFAYSGEKLFVYNDKKFNERNGWYTDPSVFSAFSFPLILGDPQTALNNPYAIVITEQMAQKYFGNENPLGKIILLENKNGFTVSGVIQNPPSNSHLQFDFLLPFQYLENAREVLKSWDANEIYTYVLLRKKISLQQVNRKIRGIISKNVPGTQTNIYLQPLVDIHLYSNFIGDIRGQGDIQYVRIFSIVALFLLLIACINFVNLSTARSAKRAKEVGLRKVVGARKGQLVGQFLGESLLMTMISVLVAILLIILVLPLFESLSGKQIVIKHISKSFILISISVTFASALLAGVYPAFFLSSFQPVKVLKGAIQTSATGAIIRKTLVVSQFILSIIIMIATLVIHNQLQFIQSKKLGYDKENIIHLPLRGELKTNYEAVKNELLQNPAIASVTAANWLPTYVGASTSDFNWEGKNPNDKVSLHYLFVDYNYIDALQMEIVAGRNFSKQFATDSLNAVILNEAAVQKMGIREPVGKVIRSASGRQLTIVGVVKDFHFKSIHTPIEPLLLSVFPAFLDHLLIKTKPGHTSQAVTYLENIYQKFNPSYPFEYKFLDEDFNALYQSEQRIDSLFNCFAFLSIFISCLGLFGLASFMAEQRVKEIGVRKVLGASVPNIVALLSKDFLQLVLIAFVIAAPIAWYAMNKWLEDFAYSIGIEWWVFLLTGLLAGAIALFTVSYQAIKTALINPVKSLRSE